MSRFSILKKLNKGGKVEKNISLSDYSTFRLGGKAKYLVSINTLEGFIRVMDYVQKNKIEYFILGAGCNLLISDRGYKGVVIRLKGDFARVAQIEDGLEFGAGVKLVEAFVRSRDEGLSGFEILGSIPGTIGGAVYMNAGAYGIDISQIISYVVAYVNGKISYFDRDECGFGYRSSVFQKNNAVILRAGFKLLEKDSDIIQSDYFYHMLKRKESQPLEYPSAGSVFKRIDGLSISKMLDDMGIKGMREGGALVSLKHANFIVNDGATAQDVYTLIHKVKEMFKDTYDIDLQIEIKFLGDFL